jgi:hypothetical protein
MAEENMTPVAGTEPPPASPIARPRASTLKLKPVIRKPTLGGTAAKPSIRPGMKLPTQAPAKPAAPEADAGGAMEQLKSVTQKLKGVTQEIPQQAILHKTGIIADQDLTEQQKQAAKSRTARISLSDAMGVAPVQNEAAPMKTIRIKRPDAISKTASIPAPDFEPAAPAAAPEPAAEPAAAKPTLTQRKTLKISRPGAVRPSGKFGVKKPGAPAPAEAPAEGGEVADMPEVADIPDMPASQPKFAPAPVSADAISDVPKGVNIASIIVQIAACAAIGFLGYCLYLDAQLPLFCGGCGWQ